MSSQSAPEGPFLVWTNDGYSVSHGGSARILNYWRERGALLVPEAQAKAAPGAFEALEAIVKLNPVCYDIQEGCAGPEEVVELMRKIARAALKAAEGGEVKP